MNIDDKLINRRSFLAESPLTDKKTMKFINNGVVADQSVVADELNSTNFSDLLSSSLAMTPVLKQPEIADRSRGQNSDALRTLARKLEQWLPTFGSEQTTVKKEGSYEKINEHAFAALYAQLLALFSSLDLAATKLTSLHASLAEKFAKSSGASLIEAAIAQKNQTVAMAATSMGVSGVGLALSHKGINQQQEAVKQNSVARNLNGTTLGLNNRGTDGRSPVDKLSKLSSAESSRSAALSTSLTTQGTVTTDPELLKLSGSKKTNSGQAVSGMGQHAGSLVSSGYGVEAATKNASAQGATVAKDSMLETEVRNRENQNAARANLKALLNLIYQSVEKNNEAVAYTTQMLKV